MNPRFSIIIPTRNRRMKLGRVLAALDAQKTGVGHEIFVIDDGSTDGTWDDLQRWKGRVEISPLRQTRRGPAAARNLGLDAAEGSHIAFLGDDTVPDPDWLESHARAHSLNGWRENIAVLGYTAWHPTIRVTPFLRYLNEQGRQFGYALITDNNDVPFNFLYTSNLSLHSALLRETRFDERFSKACWEDTELGYRLKAAGMRLIYREDARAAHDHRTGIRRFAGRQETVGHQAALLHLRHPEIPFLGLGPDGPPPLPNPLKVRLQESAAKILEPFPVSVPTLWDRVLDYHYLLGLHRGWKEIKQAV